MQLTLLATLTTFASAQLVNQATGSQQVVLDGARQYNDDATKYRECVVPFPSFIILTDVISLPGVDYRLGA